MPDNQNGFSSLVKDLYKQAGASYNPTDEDIKSIQEHYKDDYRTFMSDFYKQSKIKHELTDDDFKSVGEHYQLGQTQIPVNQSEKIDYGPFDKETVEKSPEAKQNFESWQSEKTNGKLQENAVASPGEAGTSVNIPSEKRDSFSNFDAYSVSSPLAKAISGTYRGLYTGGKQLVGGAYKAIEGVAERLSRQATGGIYFDEQGKPVAPWDKNYNPTPLKEKNAISPKVYDWEADIPEMQGGPFEFVGQLIPQTAMFATAIMLRNPQLANVAAASVGLSSMGMGLEAYDEYAKQAGIQPNQNDRYATGVAYAVAEYIPERIGLDRLMPKGVKSKVVGKILSQSPEETIQTGKEILEQFAKNNPTLAKDLFNGLKKASTIETTQEIITEIGQISADQFVTGRDVNGKEIAGRIGMAGVGGFTMGSILAPFSTFSQRAVDKSRRNKAGQLTVAQDENGKSWELIRDEKGNTVGISPDGKTNNTFKEDIWQNAITVSTEEFNKLTDELRRAGNISDEIWRESRHEDIKKQAGAYMKAYANQKTNNLNIWYDKENPDETTGEPSEWFVIDQTEDGMVTLMDRNGNRRLESFERINPTMETYTEEDVANELIKRYDENNPPDKNTITEQPETFILNGKNYSVQEVAPDGTWIISEVDENGTAVGEVQQLTPEEQQFVTGEAMKDPSSTPEVRLKQINGQNYKLNPTEDGGYSVDGIKSEKDAIKAQKDFQSAYPEIGVQIIKTKENPDDYLSDYTYSVKVSPTPQKTTQFKKAFGKQELDFNQNEDGTIEFIPNEKLTNEQALKVLQKEYEKSDKWEVVPETEQVVTPAATPLDDDVTTEVVKKIVLRPKTKAVTLEEVNKVSENVPEVAPVSETKVESTDVNTISNESILDNTALNVESFPDFVKVLSIFKQPFSDLDVKTKSSMNSFMLAMSKKPEIAKSIIPLIPVDVVNNVTGLNLTSEELLDNQSVLSDALSVDSNHLIVGTILDVLNGIGTFNGAEVKGLDLGRISTKTIPAKITNDSNFINASHDNVINENKETKNTPENEILSPEIINNEPINQEDKKINNAGNNILESKKQQKNEKESLKQAESEVNTNPSEEQKKAGNYKMGHVNIAGFDITIENPKGSKRSGKDETGKKWSRTMNNSYGYFKRTKGKDGDQIDVFIGENLNSDKVFVIDQFNKDNSFDEHKVMVGFDDITQAREAYLSNYEKGWTGLGAITPVKLEDFKTWVGEGTRRTKPFSEYAKIQKKIQSKSKPRKKAKLSATIQKALDINVFTPREIAMQYFMRGNKINMSAIQYIFGGSQNRNVKSIDGERKARISYYSPDGQGVDEIAQYLWENNENLTPGAESTEYRDAIIDVIQSFNSPTAMSNDLLQSYNKGDEAEIKQAELQAKEEEQRMLEQDAIENEILDALEKNGLIPSESQLNELFLPYESEQGEKPLNAEKVPEEQVKGNRETDRGNQQESVTKSQETELKSLQSKLKAAEKAYNAAKNKHQKLSDKLKNSPEFGNKGQADIFGGVAGNDLLDFGDDGLTIARKEVSKAKKEMDRAGDEVQKINKQIENLKGKIGQKDIFEPTPKKQTSILDKKVTGSQFKGETWKYFIDKISEYFLPTFNKPLVLTNTSDVIFDNFVKKYGQEDIEQFIADVKKNPNAVISIETSDKDRVFATKLPKETVDYLLSNITPTPSGLLDIAEKKAEKPVEEKPVSEDKKEEKPGEVQSPEKREEQNPDNGIEFNIVEEEALPETITIYGKQRPTTNSQGRPIHPTIEGIQNFYEWFGNSQVVDEQGRPIVVYSGHSNTAMFGNKFNKRKATSGGFYVSESPDVASGYATGKIGNNEYYENGDQYRFADKKGNFTKKIWQLELTEKQKQKLDEISEQVDEYEEARFGIHHMKEWAKNNYRYDPLARRISADPYNLFNIWQFNEMMGHNIAYNKQKSYPEQPEFELQQKNETEQIFDELGIKWNSFQWSSPGVFPLYVRAENPLDADKEFPADVLAELEKIAKRERPQPESMYNPSNMWTKDYPVKNFVEDIKRGDEYWTTQVPKKALEIFRQFGYDGYKERGDKTSTKTREERGVNWVAFDAWQLKSAIANKGTYDAYNDDLLLRQSQLGFYSPTERALERITQAKGTPEQFKAMLLKNGAKEAEMDYMGWDDQFPDGKKSVTKADIQDWIDQNKIEVEEVVKGEKMSREDLKIVQVEPFVYNVVDPAGNILLENVSQDKADQFVEGEWEGNDAKYRSYQEPGGQNYKEVLLTMPSVEQSWKNLDDFKQSMRDKYGNGWKTKMSKAENDSFESFVNGEAKRPKDTFKSSHFDEPNILAHIRFNERTDSEGNKVLFIEEIQSDWAQKGKKEGFKKSDKDIQQLQEELKQAQENYKKLDFVNLKISEIWNTPEAIKLTDIETRLKQAKESVPDMPFKQTPQWVNLALRRMIRYAAENNFDKIAWTNGEMQAERYDLSKQVDRINVWKHSDGRYEVGATKGGSSQFTKDGLKENEIADYVGKEIAEKAIERLNKESGATKPAVFEGLDLKVGGEGMKAFYDNIVPNLANKLGKKFGAKVESTILDYDYRTPGIFNTREEAQKYIDEKSMKDVIIRPESRYNGFSIRNSDGSTIKGIKVPKTVVNSLPITPKMYEAVFSEGLPLFQRGLIETAISESKPEIVSKLNEIQSRTKNPSSLYIGSNLNDIIAEMEKQGASKAKIEKIKEQGKKAPGFYDIGDDRVYINMQHITSSDEAIATWVHENWHKGIRNLVEDTSELDKLNEKIYDTFLSLGKTDARIRDIITHVNNNYKGETKAVKGNEMAARLAEKIISKKELAPVEKTLWGKISKWFKDFLRKTFRFNPDVFTEEQLAKLIRAAVQSNFQTESERTKTGSENVEFVEQKKVSTTPQTETEAFKNWFGNSKVVDENGKPLVVYHSTQSDFDSFNLKTLGNAVDTGTLGAGFYFTTSPENASNYAQNLNTNTGKQGGENIMPVYLSIKNPYDANKLFEVSGNDLKESKRFTDKLIKKGHDGVVFEWGSGANALKWYVAFEPTQIKSATGNNGDFDPNNPSILFQKEATKPNEKQLKTRSEKLRELLQDRELALKRWQEMITKELGVEIRDFENPYQKENLYHGRVLNKMDDFTDNQADKLIKATSKLAKAGKMEIQDVSHYMVAKHGPERNRYFWGLNENNIGKDFSGLTELQKIVAAKETDTVKAMIIESMPINEFGDYYTKEIETKVGKKNIDDFWKAVNNATEFSLKELKDSGLISKETYDNLKSRYGNYVPLRGWEQTDNFDYSTVVGEFSSPIKKAEGRKSLSDDPLSYILNMANSVILAAERNRVKQAAGNLVRNNRAKLKDLVTFKPVYFVKTGQMDANGKEVIYETIDRPEQSLWDEDKVSMKIPSEYKQRKPSSAAKEFEVEYFENGQKMVLVFEGSDPAVARAINNRELNTRIDMANKAVSNSIGRGTRYLSAVLTSMNPGFVLPNMMRDIPLAILSEYVNGNYKDAVSMLPNLKDAESAVRRALIGTPDMTNPLDIKYQQFLKNGGATGFVHLRSVDDFKKAIKRDIAHVNMEKDAGIMMGNAFRTGLKYIENLSEWSENITRFAVYLNHINKGESQESAAFEAKKSTVNFNKKGRLTPTLNGLFAFFNAGVQAGDKYFNMWGKNWKRMAGIHSFLMIQGFLNAMLLDLLGGEDEEGLRQYDKVSDYIKANYMVIPIPGSDQVVTIPMPHVLRTFHGIGFQAYNLMTNRKKPLQAITETLANIPSDVLPIDGSGFLDKDGNVTAKPITPTVLRPVIELMMNENFMGQSIIPEPYTAEQERMQADAIRYRKDVSGLAKAFTDKLYQIGVKAAGGDEEDVKLGNDMVLNDGEITNVPELFDISPETIEHLFESYTGGTGKFFNDVFKTASNVLKTGDKLLDGEDLQEAVKEINLNSIPVANRFVRQPWGDPLKNEYFKARRNLEDKLSIMKQYKKNQLWDKYIDTQLEIGIDLNFYKLYEGNVGNLDDYYNSLLNLGEKEMSKEIDKEKRNAMKRVIELENN